MAAAADSEAQDVWPAGDDNATAQPPVRAAGAHLARLQATFLDAFTFDELAQLAQMQLDVRLADVAPTQGRTLRQVVFDFILWAVQDPQVGVHRLLDAAATQNPDNRELLALQAAWRDLDFDPRPACPYPGMAPFGAEQHDRFFGRAAEIEEALQRLRLHPLLAVIGPSGVGKSSLVLAGILPAMRRSAFFGRERLTARIVRPGTMPATALADAHAGAASAPVLLVIDQMEELFARARAPAGGSLQTLLQRCRGIPGCYVIATLRADYYPELMASSLWEELRHHRLELAPLRGEGLRQAIVQPAAAVGITVEEALVERLLAESAGEPGMLPFLQETLVLLWEHLDGFALTLEAYRQVAGNEVGASALQVAMARRADLAYAALDPAGQAVARRIFLRLVQFGAGRPDTRRQQAERQLRAAGDNSDQVERVLAHLVGQRLLTASSAEASPARTIDLAHEALLAGWPRLRRWREERRTAEEVRRRLEAKAEEWERLARKGGWLDAGELAEATDWRSHFAVELGMSDALHQLVALSQERLRHERRVKRTVTLAGLAVALPLLLLAIVLGHDLLPVALGNGGWQRLPAPPGALRALAASPATACPEIALGDADYGAAWSCDGQVWSTWQDAGLPVVEPDRFARPAATPAGVGDIHPPVVALALDPLRPTRRYALLKDHGLYRWVDEAAGWQHIGAGLPENSLAAVPLAAYDDHLLYSGNDGVLYGSADGGEQWAPLSTGGAGLRGPFAVVGFDAAGQPYAGGAHGLWHGQGEFPWRWAQVPGLAGVDAAAFLGPEKLAVAGRLAPGEQTTYGRCFELAGQPAGPLHPLPVTSWLVSLSAASTVVQLVAPGEDAARAFAADNHGAVYELDCAAGWRKLGQTSPLDQPTHVAIWRGAAGANYLLWARWQSGLRALPIVREE